MIQCKCGGLISQAELTNNRERWHCQACGRYEIFQTRQPAYLFGEKKEHAHDKPKDGPYLF